MTRIVCAPLTPRIGEVDHNVATISTAIDTAVSAGADVVVLPELATSGYMFATDDEARAAAIDATHPAFSRWAAQAGDAVIVVGFAELGSDDHVYNSAAVIDGTGIVVVYRKTHLWDAEKLLFTPGSELPPVVDTPHGRISVAICYDLEFPELTRHLALQEADLIAAPVNWPTVHRPDGERPPEQIIAMATARINHLFVACCDRTGTERGQHWTEGTLIVDAQGWPAGSWTSGTMLVADVDLTDARDKQIAQHAHALTDRREQLYAAKY